MVEIMQIKSERLLESDKMVTALIIVGFTGILFVLLGYLIWKKQKINLLHDYHYDKVSEEDKEAFCALSGKGVLIIGVSMLITAAIIGITDSPWSFIVFAIGFVMGMRMLIMAGNRFNR